MSSSGPVTLRVRVRTQEQDTESGPLQRAVPLSHENKTDFHHGPAGSHPAAGSRWAAGRERRSDPGRSRRLSTEMCTARMCLTRGMKLTAFKDKAAHKYFFFFPASSPGGVTRARRESTDKDSARFLLAARGGWGPPHPPSPSHPPPPARPRRARRALRSPAGASAAAGARAEPSRAGGSRPAARPAPGRSPRRAGSAPTARPPRRPRPPRPAGDAG